MGSSLGSTQDNIENSRWATSPLFGIPADGHPRDRTSPQSVHKGLDDEATYGRL